MNHAAPSAAASLLARAHRPESFVVLRRRLVPLALGHFAWFRQCDIETVRDPGSLGLAVLICSRPPSQVLRYLTSPWFNWRMRFWRQVLGVWDFEAEARAFDAYFNYHTQTPETVAHGGSASSVIPFDQHLRMMLISRLRYDPQSVQDVSFLQARWDYLTFCEFEGWLSVQNFDRDDVERLLSDLDLNAIAAAGARILDREQK